MAILVIDRFFDMGTVNFRRFVPNSYGTSATSFRASRVEYDEDFIRTELSDYFRGIGLTYSGNDYPTGGTITSFSRGYFDDFDFYYGDFDLSGFSASAATLRQVALSADTADDVAFFRSFLSGNDELRGSNAADTIDGVSGDDRLFGRDGNDVLVGGSGNDSIDGGNGADTMKGGAGDDTLYVNDARDVVIEYSGGGTNDTVLAVASYILPDNAYIETLATFSATSLTAINLTGNAKAQTVRGGGGANRIDGRAGSDILTGLGGADTFLFSTTLGATNVDTITDFDPVADTIALSQTIFQQFAAAGPLASAAFKNIASGSPDSSDRILYNGNTGDLYYDRDGSAAGASPVLFAHLSNHAALTASDFTVV